MQNPGIQPEAQAIIEPAATRVRDPRTGRSLWMSKVITEGSLSEDTLEVTLSCHPDHSDVQMQTMREGLIQQIKTVGWHGEIVCSVTVEETVEPKKESKKEEGVARVRTLATPLFD